MIKAESISDIIYFRYMGKWCEERKVRELEKQVEAMKCCGNCEEWATNGGRSFCGRAMIGVFNICDNWQLAEKRGE